MLDPNPTFRFQTARQGLSNKARTLKKSATAVTLFATSYLFDSVFPRLQNYRAYKKVKKPTVAFLYSYVEQPPVNVSRNLVAEIWQAAEVEPGARQVEGGTPASAPPSVISAATSSAADYSPNTGG